MLLQKVGGEPKKKNRKKKETETLSTSHLCAVSLQSVTTTSHKNQFQQNKNIFATKLENTLDEQKCKRNK